MQPVLMHGFALKEGDRILYTHPEQGMMRLTILDIWPTHRLGKARWLELWSVKADGSLDKPVAIALAGDFKSFNTYPSRVAAAA